MIVKILTYNIQDGGEGREDLIKDVLVHSRADVCLLQEVTHPEFIQQLAAALNQNYFVAESHGRHRAALLSRFPIKTQNSYHPGRLTHPLLEATVEYRTGQTLSVFGAHLVAPAFDLRIEMRRVKQVRAILKRIAELKSGPYVMAGDFNAIAPGDSINTKNMPASLRLSIQLRGGMMARQAIGQVRKAGLVDCYRTLHSDAPGYTLPAARPDARLDYVFADSRLDCVACDVVTEPGAVRRASDHLPVWAEFRLGDE